MRIRSTRPHFWRSKRIASVSWDARLVLKGLESYVDDNGVGKDDIELIIGDLFQRDVIREPSRTVARVSEAISELHQGGLVWRYEHEGTALLFISFWEEVQRIDKAQEGRMPRPDGTFNYKDSAIRASSETPREDSRTFATVVGEEGSRGVGQRDDDALPEEPEPPDVVDAVVVPEHIDNASKPPKQHPSSAAKTVVRQTLGNDYPRTHVDRLAVQVEKLTREGHPDALIREALQEWQRRPDCEKPEFLPTVLGDVVKASRTDPGKVHKMRGYAALAQEVREQENPSMKELA